MTKTTVSKSQYADSRDFMTSLLFRKWTIAIILSLGTETKRYSALHRSLGGDSKSAHRAPQAARTRRHRPALFLSDDSAAGRV